MAETLILIGAAIAIAAIVIGLGLYMRAQRRKKMEAWATENGYTFEASSNGLPMKYENFKPFGQGRNRKAWHIVRGKDALEFEAFQYEYTTGSRETSNGTNTNQRQYTYTAVGVRMPMNAPNLYATPEKMGHKLFDALGGEDIDFESDSFSRKWWVKCDDRQFAYTVFHPRMISWFEQQPKHTWQWQGPTLLLFTEGHISPDKVEALLSLAKGFHSQLPRHQAPRAQVA